MLGPGLFIAIATALTWGAAAVCGAFEAFDGEGAGARLLRATLAYAAVVGWQPLVALAIARRWSRGEGDLDHGLRTTRGLSTAAVVVPIALLVAAGVVDALLHHAIVLPRDRFVPGGLGAVVRGALALVGVISVVWLQAISEELGWRGFLLTGLMRRLGAWPGLALHGVAWGLWYAPVLLVAGAAGGGEGQLSRIAGFVVTCVLLGMLLGWIRLASRSVLCSAVSNATLTLCGALPLALQGTSSTLTAIYQPAGWLPLSLAIAVIASRASLRSAVAVPYRSIPDHVN